MASIHYPDILAYLDAIMKKEDRSIDGSPHGDWWSGLSYADFTTGPVPNVGIPIMDAANPLQSAFYVILTDTGGFMGINQMPDGGPHITDPGYTATLAGGATITGAEIAANMKSWLSNGFPQ